MIQSNQKTSLFVPYQLPEYVRDNPNYSNFVAFIKAYYEWLETSDASNSQNQLVNTSNQGATYASKNILNYSDVDNTIDGFIDYYINDFLPYFPENALLDKRTALKAARQLYQSKGTIASYEFLFRVLYNSDFQVEITGDSILRPSSGKWYVAKSLRLATLNPGFLNINGYRIVGQTSKSIATIENSIISGNKTEVFISNIERLFQSGEKVIVVDKNNIPLTDGNGNQLTDTIVGQISQININPKYQGLGYQVGDPVIVYGGLNPNVTNPVIATAQVSQTSTGQIQNINVVNGGVGYTLNSTISIVNGGGASALIVGYNVAPSVTQNVSIPIDNISVYANILLSNSNYHFPNVAVSNANTTLANALSFVNLTTYPISSVVLTNGGSNISQIPQISAQSVYSDTANNQQNLASLGILGPIIISNGGANYNVGDVVIFSTTPTGYGANATVSAISASGAITAVQYNSIAGIPAGGMGYNSSYLPALTVSSATGSNAVLSVSGIIGTGASFNPTVTSVGAVQTIQITNPGEDYSSNPSVSLVVEDILVSNTTPLNLPKNGDIVYQGSSLQTATFKANVASIQLLQNNNIPTQSLYSLRVFNYNTQPNPSLPLQIYNKSINLVMANTSYAPDSRYNSNGIKVYGNGQAVANASFLNGLVLSQGQYLDTTGQLSSFSVLQSENYNNYTYKITVQKEIQAYKDILLNLLHPSGTKLIGRYALKSSNNFTFNMSDALFQGETLRNYTGSDSTTITITTDFVNKSNNIVTFQNLSGSNIANIIFSGVYGKPNSVLQVMSTHSYGMNIKSEVINVDYANNQVTLKSNTYLTYPNVAYGYANNGTTQINITQLTGSYNIINNGNYSNTSYPLMDIVYAGDKVQLSGNVYTVSSVDYSNGIIYTSTPILGNTSNGLVSVNRTYVIPGYDVKILGAIGFEYIPQLTTEDGNILTTENGNIIILE